MPMKRRPLRGQLRGRAGAVSAKCELPASMMMSPSSSSGARSLDHAVDRRARLDHDDDPARALERVDELLERLGAREVALAPSTRP